MSILLIKEEELTKKKSSFGRALWAVLEEGCREKELPAGYSSPVGDLYVAGLVQKGFEALCQIGEIALGCSGSVKLLVSRVGGGRLVVVDDTAGNQFAEFASRANARLKQLGWQPSA